MNYTVFLGANCFDEYYMLNDDLKLGDKVTVVFKAREIGGMIGNAASVFAGYGGQAYMLDFLEQSDDSAKIIERLESYNINIDGVSQNRNFINGKTIILLSKTGERLILVVENSNPKYILSEDQLAILKGCQYLYSTVPDIRKLHHHEDILNDIQRKAVKIVLDIEGASINNKEDLDIINLSNVLFINELSIEKMNYLFDDDILNKLKNSGKIVVVTMGSKGSITYTKTEKIFNRPITTKVVDTTGAGDTFNASFLYGLSEQWDLEKCGRFASIAASEKISRFGPRSGVRDLKEIIAKL